MMLEGKVGVVTGATAGLGQSAAFAMAREGAEREDQKYRKQLLESTVLKPDTYSVGLAPLPDRK